MTSGRVTLTRTGTTAHLLFDRPEARNALTWDMYEQLHAHCQTLNADESVRCAVLRGAGEQAFIAGTDIAQFLDFKTPEQGLQYEAQGEKYIAAVETLRMPTIAVVQGWAIGGGLAIAGVCDLRVATPDSRFGMPIARTLGNCLSNRNYARLAAGLGAARVKRMLMLADMIGAQEALECGFVSELIVADQLDARVEELTKRIAEHAPLSMWAGKESLRRLAHEEDAGKDDDLIARCYGSQDFHAGVAAFVDKRRANWEGR
ncbi:enoyl-CoA hydratase/isomerase family protein [Ottowia thiooxydans]|uniref:Enoyl-CoA hydratase n=1 Tax=Ottowia thiooxydans TaxID=219182 RepID=A0ABV2Q401_9BURK